MTATVLIVDDSRPMREFIRMTLGHAVVVVGECEDGSEALDAYTRLLPDWVLMDIEMKGMDGIAATQQIISEYPKAKIVIVTDHDDVELHRAALESGATGYVIKDDLLSIMDILTSQVSPD